MNQHTNRLAKESSPYLLQHAHNPVDWFPWCDGAFEKAKKEDKPVLVSIGYAACHWCHVMERESFENEEVAAFMNEHFVNIKVDREERPDVDHIYMDAVQAISGSGGWPLNVFLTHDARPFYGGTYFPPKRAFNRASWMEILEAIARAYKEGREKIDADATTLTEHLKKSNSFGAISGSPGALDDKKIDEAFKNILKTADKEWGGFGKAPKFPQTFTISFLLQYAHLKKNNEALQQALFSLDKMMQGGIYDHIGGGFARYSTDTEWLAPHFEKMLYDNALLVSTLSEAYQLTQDNKYAAVIEETLAFIEREMTHKSAGIYSALDADSEGVEGKFYVWEKSEVDEVLGDDAAVFSQYFDITEKGNWEEKNIPRVKIPLKEFAEKENIEVEQLQKNFERAKKKLLNKRSDRVRPQLDDKIILGWNALMNSAYSKAYEATGKEVYREKAVQNMEFLLQNFIKKENLFHHTWKNGEGKHPAFLDDYSYLIAALIQLSSITADTKWLLKARDITETVITHFSDTEKSLFFFTADFQTDILLRKKEVYDGATPSGNAVMAYNLYRLAILFDRTEWRERSDEMVKAFAEIIVKYPTSFGVWLQLLFEKISGTKEIAVIGKQYFQILPYLHQLYLPHKIIMGSVEANEDFPLLKGKGKSEELSEQTLIFICENYVCKRPVNSIEKFKELW